MIRLCLGQWGSRSQCPCCEDGRACLEDLVFVQLAIYAEALPERSTVRDLARCSGKPIAVVQRAFAQVFNTMVTVGDASDDEEIAEAAVKVPKWWHAHPPRHKGEYPERKPARLVWSPRLARQRWERALHRRPILKKLYPGLVLERVWRMELRQVLVPEEWGYFYQGVRQPTLYAVLCEICGRREIPQSPSLREARTDQGRIYPATRTRRQPEFTDGVLFFGIEKLLKGR